MAWLQIYIPLVLYRFNPFLEKWVHYMYVRHRERFENSVLLSKFTAMVLSATEHVIQYSTQSTKLNSIVLVFLDAKAIETLVSTKAKDCWLTL